MHVTCFVTICKTFYFLFFFQFCSLFSSFSCMIYWCVLASEYKTYKNFSYFFWIASHKDSITQKHFHNNFSFSSLNHWINFYNKTFIQLKIFLGCCEGGEKHKKGIQSGILRIEWKIIIKIVVERKIIVVKGNEISQKELNGWLFPNIIKILHNTWLRVYNEAG